MKILITGGTGFIGRHLINKLTAHQLTIVSRDTNRALHLLGREHDYISHLDVFINLDDYDAVINLAGEPIATQRWTSAQKQKISQSRWQLTQQLVDKIAASTQPPALLISGSAIGIYGRQKSHPIDESFDHFHPEFSHQLCARWEEIALEAKSQQTRVCVIRTGIVLGNGGALQKMLPPFKLCLGGKMASGRQGMSWIHIDDMVGGILYLLEHEACDGIYNLTAPNPVSNADFSQILATTLHRPALFPLPRWLITLLFGEMGELFIHGQFVLPGRLLKQGYQFAYPELSMALENILGQSHTGR